MIGKVFEFNILYIFIFLIFNFGNSVTSADSKDKPRVGNFTAIFPQRSPLSSPKAIVERMRYKVPSGYENFTYQIENERFEMYVPESYNHESPYGLLVWVSPSEQGIFPEDWRSLLEKNHLICVSANNSGNEHPVDTRRIPLALDGVYNSKLYYKIDPERIFAAGLSGGGRVASMLVVHYPDVFKGGIFIIGANYWEKVFVPGQRHQYWKANMTVPQSRFLSIGRYHPIVFLTGDNDTNQPQMKAYYKEGYKKYFRNILYLQVPEMGHEKPPIEWFEKALHYLTRGN